MVEIRCDDHDNEYYHESNDYPLLENTIGEGNYTITSARRPLLPDFQHGQGSVSHVTAESGHPNGPLEGLLSPNITTNYGSTINLTGRMAMQIERSEATSNINVSAMLATAAHMEHQREPPMADSTPHPNFPLEELHIERQPGRPDNPSPLTTSTQNGSSRAGSSSVSAPVSIANVSYQQATDGAYLSVPKGSGLRGINCLDESAFELGYDSDGELGPFFDAVVDKANWEDYDEQPIEVPEQPEQQPQDDTPAPVVVAPAAIPPQLSETIIRGMKVAELRKELKIRHQSSNGVKDVLVQRLLSCMHLPPSNDMATGADTNNNQPVESIHHGVRWRLLDPEPTPVAEPNRMCGLVAPTTHSAGVTMEARKFNYLETFDRDPFIAMSNEWVRSSSGKLRVDQRTGEPLLQEAIHEKGRPKWSFLKQNNLTEDSHLAEWFFSLLPEKKKATIHLMLQ
jgi:hypothetical protein